MTESFFGCFFFGDPKKYSNNASVPLPPPHGWASSLHSRLRKIPARFFHCHAPVLFDHLAHDHCSCTPVLFDHLDLDHRTPVLFDGLDLDHHASLSFDHLALNLIMPLFSLAILIMINVPLFSVAIFSLFFDLYSSQCSCSLSSSWLWSFYPCSLWSSSLFSGHVFSSLLSLFFVVLLLSLIIFFDQGAVWHQACVFFMLPIKAYTPLPSFLVWIFFYFVFFLFYGWLQFHELRSLTVSPVYQICHLSVSVAPQWCAFYGTCPKSPQIGRDK